MDEFFDHTKFVFCTAFHIIDGEDFDVGSEVDNAVEVFGVTTDTKLNFLPRDVGKKFPNLDSYSATECGLKIIRSHYFKGMKKLKTLDLSENDISTIEPGAFKDLKKLDQLHLQNNAIESLDKGVFAKLANLDMLFLQHNRIKFLSMLTFKIPNGQLTSINLESNVCINKEYSRCEFDDNLEIVECNFSKLERDLVANCTAIGVTAE